jgi:hypothetical protein
MRLERRWRLTVVTALAASIIGCGQDEKPGTDHGQKEESCATPDLDAPRAFVECTTGSGIFGRWQRDSRGLVAYDYRLDQNVDPRASYPVTEKDSEGQPLDRRDQWAAFGNRRVNALFVNDGYVEVVTQDRGVEYLNVFDRDQKNFAGGFGWLDDGDETWPTAYAWRPAGARTSRRFGMGWAEASVEHHEIAVTRTMASPAGAGSGRDLRRRDRKPIRRPASSLTTNTGTSDDGRSTSTGWSRSGPHDGSRIGAPQRDSAQRAFQESVG